MSNPSEVFRDAALSAEPDQAMEPFLVRGHHLINLASIATGVYTPREHTEFLQEYTARPGYVEDLFGTTEAEKDAAVAGIEQFYTDFLTLPDEARVRVTADARDGICQSCAIGNHCATTSPRDQRIIDLFKFFAERTYKRAEDVREGYYSAEDGTNHRYLEVSAETARIILGGGYFNAFALGE